MSEYNEWLKSLKVGDKVTVVRSYYGTLSYSFAEIEKITPTGLVKVKGHERKYKDGHETGLGTWSVGTRIEPVTDEIINSIKVKKLKNSITETIKNINIDQSSYEDLIRLNELLQEIKSRQDAE